MCALIAQSGARAEALTAARLGVIYNLEDPASVDMARFYAQQRGVPAANLIGVRLPVSPVVAPDVLEKVRAGVLDRLPAAVQSLLLVWSQPFAAGCMSITTAFAAGYRAGFCEPGCARTLPSPLFDTEGWLPADTVGWWPAMLLPTGDRDLARALIQRGKDADTAPAGGVAYLVRTADAARNVRSQTYADARTLLKQRIAVELLSAPVTRDVADAVAYFTGAAVVQELPRIHFRAGAAADHLTSAGGVLSGASQMTALAWLRQGATASYGTVSEPCNHLGKFPSVAVFLRHYSDGETLLESYWKSVAMPGQGLFIGEPLARAFATRHR